MSPGEVRFEIVDVEVSGRRAVVKALANGAPGHVDLVREDGRFKVVALRGT